MKSILFLLSILISISLFAQKEESISLKTATGNIHGKLLLPKKNATKTVALLIQGSGPTDMNGNNTMMQNNSLKMVAEALAKEGIAVVRYDKRGVASSMDAIKKEEDLRFDDYVNDVAGWIELLSTDKRFEKIVVLGHSEGSLLGAAAVVKTGHVTKYISLAGIGEPANITIRKQLSVQPESVTVPAYAIMDELEKGNLVADVTPMLMSVFRPSVQPYIISWFKYNPLEIFAQLKVPTLIVQGTNDVQVATENAKLLTAANPLCKELIIERMNHILKDAPEDRAGNLGTYSNPNLPLHQDLMKPIVDFILE